jgi:SAM-dependent methyltransferase
MSADGSNGWNESAEAWIADLGAQGDYGRRYVLDPPMIARVCGQRFEMALDVGCGEGRFCRIMQRQGVRTVGVDPTQALIDRARLLDPGGDYRVGRGEALDFAGESFDLVVSYLSLIDMPDLPRAMAHMIQILRPGGTLLIANLTSFNTAGMPDGWQLDSDGQPRFSIDNYLDERAVWVSWRDIRIQNWHRPLSAYMAPLLEGGMQLRHFCEPAPTGGDPQKAERYRRVPYFHIMEWRKPAIGEAWSA